ncbi:helix-turn-helix domain-containing protein [Aureibaculum sp. A20]|uniref:Helix-turn-helix domain-containing protein n=1 Tax=Aureibaculum flavum TaxID=2795986 RepID=A0ABS0WPL9_9FLAO|nr:helix-turn-helix domain-containing protein [Aureibaculum flavum]MBJ2173920.1 helix-turn-helix domain-containing protein [Aureibaculum flavum]
MQEELSMDQDFIKKLYGILEVNLENEEFGVNELSEAIGISRSQLHRKLKSIERKSASRFIREYRLQKAMEMLRNNAATASEISYSVGFGSPTYFNTCFREFYGYPPGEVKFRKESKLKENDFIEGSIVENNAAPNLKKPIRRNFIAITSLIIVLLAATAYYFYQNSKNKIASDFSVTKTNDKSIAILPFKNLSSNKENQYFADGIMEVILNHLTSIEELKVISRTSMEQYRETNKTIPEIAKELGVSHILQASVQKDNDEIRIISQLIDAKNDTQIWSTDIKKEYKDIFELQSTIAEQISKELNTELSDVERIQIKKKPTNNLEAYNLYLKGVHFNRSGSPNKSVSYLEQAIEKDPEFAFAYSELAVSHMILMSKGKISPNKNVKKTKELAQKAIALDHSIGEPHHVLATMLFRYEWNWKAAEKELLIALKLNPNNPFTHLAYSKFLKSTNRMEESRKHIDKALTLDPVYHGNYFASAEYYYCYGDYEKAFSENKKGLDLKIKFTETNWLNFEIYVAQKKYDKAIVELQKLYKEKESHEIDKIYKKFGINGVYNWLIKFVKNNYNTPYYLAQNYAFIGEHEKALSLLEKSVELRVSILIDINIDPNFKNLRSEPRFKIIIKKMGLDVYYNE